MNHISVQNQKLQQIFQMFLTAATASNTIQNNQMSKCRERQKKNIFFPIFIFFRLNFDESNINKFICWKKSFERVRIEVGCNGNMYKTMKQLPRFSLLLL